MTRVLVCGGRNYEDRERVFDVLDALNKETPISAIIEGGADGADRSAYRYWREKCDLNTVKWLQFRAEWERDGKAAGPARNHRMLVEGKPDLVVAFPGGRGTADMVKRAKAASIPVRTVV